MNFTTRKVPDQPTIHGAKFELTVFSTLSDACHIIKDPLNSCSGVIRFQLQACVLLDYLRVALALQFLANVGCSAILPHNGIVIRFAGFSIPDQSCLSLICNSNRCEPGAWNSGGRKHLCRYSCLG